MFSPPQLTGGKGFSFEDQVGAWCLAQMLAGICRFGADIAQLQRVEFQTGADGWHLDDLLVTWSEETVDRRCAISIKSNRQFSRRSAPPTFVAAAWNQYLEAEHNPFDSETDQLGIITAPLSAEVSDALQRLCDAARTRGPGDMSGQIDAGAFSGVATDLYRSLACPANLADRLCPETDHTPELLRRLVVLPLDLQQQSSGDLAQAIRWCREALESGDLVAAAGLWQALLGITSDHRVEGGQIDLAGLLALLRDRFRLKEHPDYRRDWEQLVADSGARRLPVTTKIGGKVHLPRLGLLQDIREKMERGPLVALIGESGCGKSALARCLVDDLGNTPAIWLNASLFDVDGLPALGDRLRLQHRWQALMRHASRSRVVLVLDGMDRLWSDQGSAILAPLLEPLALGDPQTPFRVLITCQPRSWETVQMRLLDTGVSPASVEVIEVQGPDPDELQPLLRAYPQMRPLLGRHHLARFLGRPKILDLLAKRLAIEALPDTRRWVGEADFIHWFWRMEIADHASGAARERMLLRLADEQAKGLRSSVPVTDLHADELSVCAELEAAGLLCRADGRLDFGHDLYADWARQRLLLLHEADLAAFLDERLDSPAWHRPLVLLGLDLLERRSDWTKWEALVAAFSKEDAQLGLVGDLLLEALVQTPEADRTLEHAWRLLAADQGRLLRRLLIRFLQAATRPNPRVLAFAKETPGFSLTHAATLHRLPLPALWLPVLQWVHRHADAVTDLVPLQASELADTWLRFSASNWPLRDEVADLALSAAWRILRDCQHRRRARRWPREDARRVVEPCYAAALNAVLQRPDQVLDFALCACGRRPPTVPPPPDPVPPIDEEAWRARLTPEQEAALFAPSPFEHARIEIPPWPDGPRYPVDSGFRDLCLEHQGLDRMIAARPEACAEIILALCIRAGGNRWPDHDAHDPDGAYELVDPMGFFPPLYDRGPFKALLDANPDAGIKLVLTLIEFATERWRELFPKRQADRERAATTGLFPADDGQFGPILPVGLADGATDWVGDERWLHAYRDVGAPKLVVCALMALERWLYERMDAGEDIAPIIERLLADTRSLAVAGTLLGVAKRRPALFSGPLRSFLALPELYRADQHHLVKSERHQMIGWGPPNTQQQFEAARDWHGMPHRKLRLEDIAFTRLREDAEVRRWFDTVLEHWRRRLLELDPTDPVYNNLFRLSHQLDLANWTFEPDAEEGERSVFLAPPELAEWQQRGTVERIAQQAFFYFPFRCRQAIEAGEPLTESQWAALWEQGQWLLDREPTNPEDRMELVRREDLACALAAVGIRLARGALQDHPDQERWCIETLTKTPLAPPPRQPFDTEESTMELGWDNFCADALPGLWTEAPQDPGLRLAVGVMVFAHHHQTVERLFALCAELRASLGDDFERLRHLLMRGSVLRHRLLVKDGTLWGEEPANLEALDQETRRLVQSFVDAVLPAQVPPWRELEHAFADDRPSLCDPDHRGGHHYHPRSPGIDLITVARAHNWLPGLDQADSEAERQCWLSFWDQCVKTLCWCLGDGAPEVWEIDGMPYQFDRWLLERLPRVLLTTRTDDEARSLWRPLLALGEPGHHWVSCFVDAWWRTHLSGVGERRRFLSMLRDMTDFADSHWEHRQGQRYELDSLWCGLMGLGAANLLPDYWGDDQQPLVSELKDRFAAWAAGHLRHESSCEAFVRFLSFPAAKPLRPIGLIWLAEHVERHGFWHWDYIEAALMNLLEGVLPVLEQGLDADARAAYLRLLRELVERQNPRAQTLSERIVQGNADG